MEGMVEGPPNDPSSMGPPMMKLPEDCMPAKRPWMSAGRPSWGGGWGGGGWGEGVGKKDGARARVCVKGRIKKKKEGQDVRSRGLGG